MSRSKPGRGRVTSGSASSPAPAEPEIAPLYKRKPGTFVFLMLAVLAMVFSTVAGVFQSLV